MPCESTPKRRISTALFAACLLNAPLFCNVVSAGEAVAGEEAACKVPADRLTGVYTFVSGDTQLDAFELTADGRFLSWLHERPEHAGHWQLQQCDIHLHGDTETDYQLRVLSRSDTELVVAFSGLSQPAVFRTHSFSPPANSP